MLQVLIYIRFTSFYILRLCVHVEMYYRDVLNAIPLSIEIPPLSHFCHDGLFSAWKASLVAVQIQIPCSCGNPLSR